MHKTLLDVLRCPQSLSAFRWKPLGPPGCGLLLTEHGPHWYPVVDHIPEVIRPDLWSERGRAFVQDQQGAIESMGVSLPDLVDAPAADVLAQQQQREHFDHYADRTDQDYQAYQQTPFWRAVDEWLFRRWNARVAADALVLDIGCADGRSAFQWASQQRTVIGFDISRRMVECARDRARREGLADRMAFVVADGDQMPFAAAAFDAVCTYGVLHHVPDPSRTLEQACQLLKPGNGQFFALENNSSALRFAFDALMRVLPLWFELAGSEPLISRSQFRDWLKGQPVDHQCFTSVFLPPHILNWLGTGGARSLLRVSDGLSRAVPWWKHQGGLIVLEVQRSGA